MGRYTELQMAWNENREDFRRLKEEMDRNEEAFRKMEKEMEELEQEPIKDSDVVVMFSSQFASDYAVYKITDQSREWVKAQMETIAGMDEDTRSELVIEEYFRSQGAEAVPILDSSGKGDDYPFFYDFWYDMDGTEVVENTERPIKDQVKNLINRIDFGEPVLNDSEWKLLYAFAEKNGDMEAVYRLAKELRDTLHEPDFRVHEQVIEKAWKEIKQPEELTFSSEAEKELFTGGTDRFGIYQLKEGEELRYHHFTNLDLLEKSGLQVEKENYELIYTAPLQEGQTLDDIFEQFNLFRPEDFTGRSLSVSDIVLIHKNGENHAQYVDSVGFREVPQFLDQVQEQAAEEERPFIDHFYVVTDLQKTGPLEIEKYGELETALQAYFTLPNDKMKAFGVQNSLPLPGSLDFIQCIHGIDRMIFDYESMEHWNRPEIHRLVERIDIALDQHETQIAHQIGEGYFAIQHTEGGFDYTFYDRDFLVLDGGIYDDPNVTIQEAMDELLQEQHLHPEEGAVLNYDTFMEQVEEAERAQLEMWQKEYLPVYRYPAGDAWEHGEIKEYRASMNENIACKSAIETAIRENFDGMHLNHDAATPVLAQYGVERVSYVLANTVRELESDGRFSRDNKTWAQTVPIYTDRGQNTDFLVTSHPAVLDGFIGLVREKIREKERKAFLAVSDMTQPEASLNHMSRADIEETVLAYARSVAEEAGYEVKLRAARVYGSRTAGVEKEGSDVDVVLEFEGEIREDAFFNLLHEDGLTLAGMPVDINPITAEKTGTIEEFLARANEYLEEKVKSMREAASVREKVEVVLEPPAQVLSFYVAECMEFPMLGEYHDNLDFEEAVRICESIPSSRINGIKGIGFVLHTENEPDQDLTYELVSGRVIDVDMINHVPEFRDSPLVQQAVQDAIARFPGMEVWDKETRARESREMAQSPRKRVDDLRERREKNPLAKVEELEEANYNQIDGILNNLDVEEKKGKDIKGLSIMDKLAMNQERITGEKEESSKASKETDRKPDRDGLIG